MSFMLLVGARISAAGVDDPCERVQPANRRILKRLIADAINGPWFKYLKFAICVLGIRSWMHIFSSQNGCDVKG